MQGWGRWVFPQPASVDIVIDGGNAKAEAMIEGRVSPGHIVVDGQPEQRHVAPLRDGAGYLADGPAGDYALDDVHTPAQARERVQQLLRHDAISDSYAKQPREIPTSSEQNASQRSGLTTTPSRIPRAPTQQPADRSGAGKRSPESSLDVLDTLQRKADAMSYSGVNGVMQLGEMLDLGVNAVRLVPGMAESVRGYVKDADAVSHGRDELEFKEVLPTVLAASVSGLGSLAYGAASGMGDLASRLFTPGEGADRYQQANAHLHQGLEQGFERWVQSQGTDTDTATYRKAKADALIAGTVVGGSAVKAKSQRTDVGRAIAGSTDDVIEYSSAKVNGQWVAEPVDAKFQTNPYANAAQPTPRNDIVAFGRPANARAETDEPLSQFDHDPLKSPIDEATAASDWSSPVSSDTKVFFKRGTRWFKGKARMRQSFASRSWSWWARGASHATWPRSLAATRPALRRGCVMRGQQTWAAGLATRR
jgi:hypothetical protein